MANHPNRKALPFVLKINGKVAARFNSFDVAVALGLAWSTDKECDGEVWADWGPRDHGNGLVAQFSHGRMHSEFDHVTVDCVVPRIVFRHED